MAISQRHSASQGRPRTRAAWALLVVSDPGQRDTLAHQRAWAETTAKANGWTVTRTFQDVSTGRDGTRRLVTEMIAALEEMPAIERPVRILTIRLDRIGRGNGLEAMTAFARIRELGVTLHTRQDGDVSAQRASELLMPVLRFFVAGMENEVRRDKLLAVYERKRAAAGVDPRVATGTRAPYGLCIQKGHLVEQMPEANTVRLIYDLKLKGYSCHRIAKELQRVAPPLRLVRGDLVAQKWNADRVMRLIRKPVYRYVLVNDDTWYRAQHRFREIARPVLKYEYSLGGAMRCECGRALAGHRGPSVSRPVRYRYYYCKDVQAHGGRTRMHRSTDLEGQFLGLLRRLSAPESFLEARFEASAKSQRRHLLARLSTLKKELSTVAVRRAKVFNAFEAGDLAQKFLQQRLEELRAEEDSLGAAARAVEDELAVDRAKRASLDSAKSIVQEAADTWLMANIPDRQAIAKKVAEIVGGLFVRFEDHTLYPGIDENKRCVEKRESSTVTPLVSEVFKGA